MCPISGAHSASRNDSVETAVALGSKRSYISLALMIILLESGFPFDHRGAGLLFLFWAFNGLGRFFKLNGLGRLLKLNGFGAPVNDCARMI